MDTMRNSSKALLFCVVSICVAPTPALGQTYTCLPDTAESASLLRDYVVLLVTGSDTGSVATRDRYQLPATQASKVTVETSTNVCNNAGAAYHAAEDTAGTPPISRTLVVVKVASSRYVVLNPGHLAGEYEVQIVFDSRWNVLCRFLS